MLGANIEKQYITRGSSTRLPPVLSPSVERKPLGHSI